MTTGYLIFLIVYGILTHLIAERLGTRRRIAYGDSVFWSVLLTPIIGFIVTILSPENLPESDN